MMLIAAETGAALKSWSTFYVLIAAFVAIVAGLIAFGHSGNTESRTARLLLRIPDGLQRLVHIPGWAAATVSLALFGLFMAGQGFYNDVAWHVGLGRDKELFTAPHTGIVVGLGMILMSGVVGVLFASLQRVDTALSWKAVRIPWSALPLLALGGAAVTGFPLDELWHREFGVDVTMWSPTHMLMILGAAFVGVASWLVLADAGVKPHDSRWSMGIHVVAAWLTLQGLIAPLGEFAFGVPQFQQIFHPMILVIASAFAFVAMRLVLGPWWAIGIAGFNIVSTTNLLNGGKDPLIETKVVGIYIFSAIAVEIAARVVGTEHRVRFAVVAGIAVATFGFAGDYWWNANNAYQKWNTNLLPDAVVFGVIVGVAAALLATAFARAAGYQEATAPIPAPVLAVAGLTLLVCLALPMPRHVGNVTGAVTLGKQVGGYAKVSVTLDPPNAAENARFFQAGAWAGGGLELADMREIGDGRYVSEHRIPVSGGWKSMLRLHRGGEMMAIALHLPSDPELHKRELVAADRTMRFQPEPKYLLREAHAGNNVFKNGVYTLLAGVVLMWMAAFAVAVGKIAPNQWPRGPHAAKLAGDEHPLHVHAA